MADIYVNTVSEFINLSNTANNGDNIYVTADLDFSGKVYSGTLVTLPQCTLDGQGHTLLNITIRSTDTDVRVFSSTKGGVVRSSTIKNFAQIDLDLSGNDTQYSVTYGFSNADNVKFSVRAECRSYYTLLACENVSKCAFLVNVYAVRSSSVVGTGSNVSNCRVGGKIYVQTGSSDGIGEFSNVSRCIVNAVVVSANGNACGITGRTGSTFIRDCVVEGVIRAVNGFVVGTGYYATSRRCIVRAKLEGSIAVGFIASRSYGGIVSECLFDGSLKYTAQGFAITMVDDYRYAFNNFRSYSALFNDVPSDEQNTVNGYKASAEDIDSIAFYRDVLGFDV